MDYRCRSLIIADNFMENDNIQLKAIVYCNLTGSKKYLSSSPCQTSFAKMQDPIYSTPKRFVLLHPITGSATKQSPGIRG